jgi:hypothetical protein
MSDECEPTFWRNVSPPSSGSKSEKEHEAHNKQSSAYGSILMDLPKRRFIFSRLRGVIAQKKITLQHISMFAV